MKELQISILQEKNNTLHGVIWATDEQPKAVLQITHGMTEHIQRYKELAENLNKYGIVVAGFDLRGHGRNLSNRNCSSLGENGWEQSLNDIKIFSDFLHNKFPNCPHYILGFSLGSFLVREYLNKCDHNFSGAIIAGTGYQPNVLLSILIAIVKTQINAYGFDSPTPLVNQLSFETYNAKFRPNNTVFDWLCSDEQELHKYISDALCANSISAGLFYQLLNSLKYTGRKDAYVNYDKDMPILLLSGEKDPVGNFGKGIKNVEKAMKKAGLTNCKTYLISNARHDIFHEINSGCTNQVVHLIQSLINKT